MVLLAGQLPNPIHHEPPGVLAGESRIVPYTGQRPYLGGDVALLVLLIVGVVVVQTWLEWRDTRRGWHLPQWARGLALGALVVTPLTATASFASMWYEDSLGLLGRGVGAWFWFEMGFAL